MAGDYILIIGRARLKGVQGLFYVIGVACQEIPSGFALYLSISFHFFFGVIVFRVYKLKQDAHYSSGPIFF